MSSSAYSPANQRGTRLSSTPHATDGFAGNIQKPEALILGPGSDISFEVLAERGYDAAALFYVPDEADAVKIDGVEIAVEYLRLFNFFGSFFGGIEGGAGNDERTGQRY